MDGRIFNNKELLFAVLLTIFYLFTGFTPNPLAWPDQVKTRIALTENIEPNNPQIQQLDLDFEKYYVAELLKNSSISDPTKEYEAESIETYIRSRIPYVTDFINYLAWDHYPKISEVLKRGDDCDGIVFVGCSLLTRRGFDAYILYGKWHSWIEVHLEETGILTLFDDRLNAFSPWYIKYNTQHVYINEISFFELILFNFLFILALEKIFLTSYFFIRRYEAIQSVYTSILAILVPPALITMILFSLNS